MIDLLARQAKEDPLTFILQKLTKDSKEEQVLSMAVKIADWYAPLPKK